MKCRTPINSKPRCAGRPWRRKRCHHRRHFRATTFSAVPAKVAELTELARRHERSPQQAVFEQLLDLIVEDLVRKMFRPIATLSIEIDQRNEQEFARGKFRVRHGFKAEEFLAIYSGNLGVKQGLDILVTAAKQLSGTPVRIVICGDGAIRPKLEASIQQEQLQNITLLPLQPDQEYQEMLADADVCLITQQAGSGAAFFPSKLLAVLALSRPVVGVADDTSELRRALTTGGFGKCVPPGDASQLAQVLQSLAADRAELGQYGMNGRKYVEQFAFATVLPRFTADLEKLIKRP